ncbi:hypothetical protein Tco_0185722 [Tanacetum coccineum]
MFVRDEEYKGQRNSAILRSINFSLLYVRLILSSKRVAVKASTVQRILNGISIDIGIDILFVLVFALASVLALVSVFALASIADVFGSGYMSALQIADMHLFGLLQIET